MQHLRYGEWIAFSRKVADHITNYTYKQYGADGKKDFMSKQKPEFCIQQIQKYCERFGNNARSEQDELDMIKVAHYACMCYFKLKWKERGDES